MSGPPHQCLTGGAGTTSSSTSISHPSSASSHEDSNSGTNVNIDTRSDQHRSQNPMNDVNGPSAMSQSASTDPVDSASTIGNDSTHSDSPSNTINTTVIFKSSDQNITMGNQTS